MSALNYCWEGNSKPLGVTLAQEAASAALTLCEDYGTSESEVGSFDKLQKGRAMFNLLHRKADLYLFYMLIPIV